MHIQNGARSVARALPFAPSARAYVFVSGPASDGRMSLSYLISPYLIFEQAVIIRCKDGLASDGSISGEGEGVWEERNDDLRDGVGALARSECESSTRKRRSNATTTLSRAPTTRSLRVFIYTYVHARPSYNSFFLSHPLSDTLWPVSNLFSLFDSKNSLFWEISREIGRIRSLVFFFFFFFSFPRVFFSHKSDGPSRRRGGEVKLDE